MHLIEYIQGLIQIANTNEKNIKFSEKSNKCRDGKYKHREKRGELYIIYYVDHTINSEHVAKTTRM